MATYWFTTATGETHQSTSTPAQIVKVHPGATITQVVTTDPITGESTKKPYTGQQPATKGEPMNGDTGPTGPTGSTGPTGTDAPDDDTTANPTQEG